MTVKDVFELRKQGRIEEAYGIIRSIYAGDKGPYASLAMFWTAVDVFKKRITENRIDEAYKILLALERMLPHVPDKEGWVQKAYKNSVLLLDRAGRRLAIHEKQPEHLLMGKWGEELAAAYLREKGYVILERDWHSGHRDIDIIARNNNYVVFVEVKTRRNRDFEDPIMAVNYEKQRNLRIAINHYIKFRKIDSPIRFDIITIVGAINTNQPYIEHLEDVNISASPKRR